MTPAKDTPVKDGTVAKLVWDGGEDVHIPEEMGTPLTTQMKGTPMERVSELACRVCYDSLGRGRSSGELHEHILGVKHLSVYEHTHMTVELLDTGLGGLPLQEFLNRPGVWVQILPTTPGCLRVTFNPRVVLNWNNFSSTYAEYKYPEMRRILAQAMAEKCPMIVMPDGEKISKTYRVIVVEPSRDEEKWITMFLGGSRGFSHELVRHGDFTAISQRSTRYVDEDGSPRVDHPLVHAYLKENKDEEAAFVLRDIDAVKSTARTTYDRVATVLQAWLKAKGVDKFNARKQARGAARGYLGNALYTELIFSASVAQWKRMLQMRCCDAADAEIRVVFSKILPELQKSRYGESFKGFCLEPSSDGIGMVAVER